MYTSGPRSCTQNQSTGRQLYRTSEPYSCTRVQTTGRQELFSILYCTGPVGRAPGPRTRALAGSYWREDSWNFLRLRLLSARMRWIHLVVAMVLGFKFLTIQAFIFHFFLGAGWVVDHLLYIHRLCDITCYSRKVLPSCSLAKPGLSMYFSIKNSATLFGLQ